MISNTSIDTDNVDIPDYASCSEIVFKRLLDLNNRHDSSPIFVLTYLFLDYLESIVDIFGISTVQWIRLIGTCTLKDDVGKHIYDTSHLLNQLLPPSSSQNQTSWKASYLLGLWTRALPIEAFRALLDFCPVLSYNRKIIPKRHKLIINMTNTLNFPYNLDDLSDENRQEIETLRNSPWPTKDIIKSILLHKIPEEPDVSLDYISSIPFKEITIVSLLGEDYIRSLLNAISFPYFSCNDFMITDYHFPSKTTLFE